MIQKSISDLYYDQGLDKMSVESERKEPEKEESVEESETSKNILKLVTSHKSCDVKL